MDNKSYEQFLIIQATVETNKQDNDEKLTNIIENLKFLTVFMMDQTNNSELSPSQKYTLTPLEPNNLVLSNRRDPPLDGGDSTKIGGMWTLKHEISSPKCYELLIRTELKKYTALDIKNFYNHIKICLNVVTRI